MDGPEPLVEADEYLQPKFKSNAGTATTNTTCTVGAEPQAIKACATWTNNTTGQEGIIIDNSNRSGSWDRDLLRYNNSGNQEAIELRHYYNHGVSASESSSSRYCSDPMRMRPDCIDVNMSKAKEAHVGNLKLNLPLDEDDYLMPSPQHTQNASAYMDLIGESTEGQDPKDLCYTGYLASKRCVDNPEYLMSEQNIPSQTLGIPTEPETPDAIHSAEASGVSVGSGPSASEACPGAPPELVCSSRYLPHRSVEEESMSDHEYYNDLQRELQPLRRNETTV